VFLNQYEVQEKMKHKNLWVITIMISSLFLFSICSVQAADVTITDGMGDVSSVDYMTGETKVVTSSPDIDVDNLDILEATYTQQGAQATVSMHVKGIIENRGQILDPYSQDMLNYFNAVEYGFQVTTSDEQYMISYSNQTGQLVKSDEQINLTSSDFTVSGGTLTITFTLLSATEQYENLSVTTTFIKANFSSDSPELVYLSDVAPNPPLEVFEAYASNVGSVGETIQFNGSVSPLTGQPPYTYRWNFGDQGSSTQLNPTHIYTKAGVYTYTFTITDASGSTASESGSITISEEGGSSGSGSNQMILFLAVLLIIVVIGVIIIVWIIRR
jgi:hypothetical protein